MNANQVQYIHITDQGHDAMKNKRYPWGWRLQTETENNNLEISYIMLYQKRYAKVSGSIHFGTVKCK